MAATRKVFFGSLYEFSSSGAEEVLDGLRDQFADPETVPFVSYDKDNGLFSCEVDAGDHDTIPMINAQIEAYITLHSTRKPIDSLEPDRLRPIEGTAVRDEVFDVRPQDTEHNLLFEIHDPSSDEDDRKSDQRNATYWTPRCGDISILSREFASVIADATGCFFIPDQTGRRIQLEHGNTKSALQKLETLEDALALAARHRSVPTSCANANILLSPNGPESAIKFVRPVQPLCGFDRILLESAQLPLFNQIFLGEIRIWQDGRPVKPVNLDLEDVSITAYNALLSIFGETPLPRFGDAKSAEPRAPSNENSQTSGEVQRPGSPTKFLGHKETERVEEWRGKVDPEATPNLPPAEPLPDEEKKLGRRRVKAEESSDEEEEAEAQALSSRNIPSVQHKPTSFSKPPVVKADRGTSSTHSRSSDSAHSRIIVTELQRSSQLGPTKTALKSSNMFELIDLDDVPVQEPVSEGPISDQSSGRVKQLNVTFEEPEMRLNNAKLLNTSPMKSQSSKADVQSFDPSDYGVKKHMSKSARTSPQKPTPRNSENKRIVPISQQYTGPRSSSKTAPPTLPSYKQETHSRDDANQSDERTYFGRHQHDLIDITFDKSPSEGIAPPPGFDYRSNTLPDQKDSFAMSQREAAHRPVPRSTSFVTRQTASSPGKHESSPQHASHQDFAPQYTAPKRNISYLKNQSLSHLERQMGIAGTDKGDKKENDLSPNRIQKNDEFSTRKYHSTMGQKMARPGKKGKGSSNQETKAEREARINKAKLEAYGSTNVAKGSPGKSQPAKTQRPTAVEDMSVRKRQLLKKNQAMADLHQDELAHSFIQDAAAKLVEELRPIFQATRAFRGVVKVEIQFGQALILKSGRLDVARLYTTQEWTHLFKNSGQNDTRVTFTNIVTTNGQDIDRIFETKADGKAGADADKLWDKTSSTSPSTAFEFACQDKAGNDFALVLREDGKHNLERSPSTIGQIVLHSPNQVWDACAIVSGTMDVLRPSEGVTDGVEQFIENLYIPGGKKAAVYFRLPANNSFTIRAITVKRVSAHNCMLPDRASLELRITEVKTLAHSANPTDKKLYRSYESSYEVMVKENRIHYEVAIADKSIESAFSANPDLEVGELVPIDTPTGTLINFPQAHGLIETTTHMLKNIDWLGASNIGTLRQMFDNATDQRATIVSALPPNLNRSLPIPMGTTAPPNIAPPTAYQSQHSRVGTGANITSPEPALRPIPGVRTNTAAELYQDPSTGELFYYGQGGARIPVVNEEFEGPRLDGLGPVLPGDSASQIGGDTKRKVVGGAKKGWDDKPAGFW